MQLKSEARGLDTLLCEVPNNRWVTHDETIPSASLIVRWEPRFSGLLILIMFSEFVGLMDQSMAIENVQVLDFCQKIRHTSFLD